MVNDMPSAPKIHFKDVAATLARWLARGAKEPVEQLSKELWGPSSIPLREGSEPAAVTLGPLF